jgi:hypothetical protein
MEAITPPALPTVTEQWFYEIRGTKNGPVDTEQIKELLANNTIRKSTLVWKRGFEDWKRLQDSELAELIEDHTPPPLTGSKVNNVFVWILAFAPLWVEFIKLSFGLKYYLNENNIPPFAIYAVVNTALVLLDSYLLKKAGYEDNILWGVFFIPVYLWKRAVETKQSKAYFWIWIIALIVSNTPGFMDGVLLGLQQ